MGKEWGAEVGMWMFGLGLERERKKVWVFFFFFLKFIIQFFFFSLPLEPVQKSPSISSLFSQPESSQLKVFELFCAKGGMSSVAHQVFFVFCFSFFERK